MENQVAMIVKCDCDFFKKNSDNPTLNLKSIQVEGTYLLRDKNEWPHLNLPNSRFAISSSPLWNVKGIRFELHSYTGT